MPEPALQGGGEAAAAPSGPALGAGPRPADGALSATRPTRRAAQLRSPPRPPRRGAPAAAAAAAEAPAAPAPRPGRGRPRRTAAADADAGVAPATTAPKKKKAASKKGPTRFGLDDGEAAAVAGVLGPLAQRSAALSTPIPPGLADTPEADDLRVMVALDDRLRSGRNAKKAGRGGLAEQAGSPLSATAAAPASAKKKGGGGGDAAAVASADEDDDDGGDGPAGSSSSSPSAAPTSFIGEAQATASAHPVAALFAMLGHTGLLTRDAEARLSEIVRKGSEAADAGEALAAHLGRAPTVREVVASLGLRSPAHLRLLLANRQVAQDLMVQFNLRLVVHTAKRYTGMGLELADLITEGVAGLTRAIDKYDPGRGFKFSTYSMWWVRQAITRALSDQSRVVRLPVHVYDAVSKLRRAGRALGSTVFESQEALHEALAEAVGLPVEKVTWYLAAARTTRSLDAPTSGAGSDAMAGGGAGGGAASGGGSAGSGSGSATDNTADPMNESLTSSAPTDVLDGGPAGPGGRPGDDPLSGGGGRGDENSEGAAARAAALRTHGVLRQRLDAVLASLPPRERNVLRLRYGLAAPGGRTMTLLDISTAYGVTTERIRQIEDSGLRRLRDPLRAAGVKDAAELVSAADAGGVAAADEVAALIAPPGVEAGPEVY
jgi:RNA polymerase sigma factor (sigma-70 family)